MDEYLDVGTETLAFHLPGEVKRTGPVLRVELVGDLI